MPQEEVVEAQVEESLFIIAGAFLMGSLRLLVGKGTWRTEPLEPCTWKRQEMTP